MASLAYGYFIIGNRLQACCRNKGTKLDLGLSDSFTTDTLVSGTDHDTLFQGENLFSSNGVYILRVNQVCVNVYIEFNLIIGWFILPSPTIKSMYWSKSNFCFRFKSSYPRSDL